MEIRFGTQNDIFGISIIQKYWLEQTSENDQGFLFGDPYTNDDLLMLTLRNQISVAVKNNKVYGYFIFDDYSKNHTTINYKEYLKKLNENGNLGYSIECICPRAQIAISKDSLGHNISKNLTQFLIENCPNKFDAIFSTVSKKNIKIEKHLNNGWTIIGKNEELHFVLLSIKTKHNNGSKQLVSTLEN